jgi:thiol-disulfide isomerase/thioredoxin
LEAIHFRKISRSYNCQNIANFYVCKYIYKCASEIDHLITRFKDIASLDTYDILSIGCGPCSELAGLLNFLSRSKQKPQISFIGIDSNELWKPIHERIQVIVTSYDNVPKVRFLYGDALKIIPRFNARQVKWRPNILILQYLISDMKKAGVNIENFVVDLSTNIVPIMPAESYIILNDINHYWATDYFDCFEKYVTRNYATQVYRTHFQNRNRNAFAYGDQYTTNSITTQIPTEIDARFDPWAFCTSAQMVIRKRS